MLKNFLWLRGQCGCPAGNSSLTVNVRSSQETHCWFSEKPYLLLLHIAGHISLPLHHLWKRDNFLCKTILRNTTQRSFTWWFFHERILFWEKLEHVARCGLMRPYCNMNIWEFFCGLEIGRQKDWVVSWSSVESLNNLENVSYLNIPNRGKKLTCF